jgi:hypothetical protein
MTFKINKTENNFRLYKLQIFLKVTVICILPRLKLFYPKGARRLPGGCPEAARRLPGGCPEAARRLPGGCPEAARMLPGGCPEAAQIHMAVSSILICKTK